MTQPPKPPYGSPCNGCGRCCQAVVCNFGLAVLKIASADRVQPCPALEERPDGSFACGLVRSPAKYAPDIAAVSDVGAMSAAGRLIIGDGIGCDAPTRREAMQPDYRRKRAAIDSASAAIPRLARLAAFQTWGLLK